MNTHCKRLLLPTLSIAALLISASAFALSGGGPNTSGCPDFRALVNFKVSNLVSAAISSAQTLDPNTNALISTTATYTFSSINQNPIDGIPGLIEYCVYPTPATNPDSGTVSATGADNSPWKGAFNISQQGYFEFKRPDGDPSNIPFDGSNVTMGTATWNAADPYPGDNMQTILLHINNPAECNNLYNDGSQTCFVLPSSSPPQQQNLCNGQPACKEVDIREADPMDSPHNVPAHTLLHAKFIYEIVNQPTNNFDMIFDPPTPKTQDINSGGAKDYFGCEWIADPNGSPGASGLFPNYQGTLFNMNLTTSKGNCAQGRFTMIDPGPAPIVLHPGDSKTFTVDMMTRTNSGGQQEYTSCGSKVLNSGFTVKWFQNNDDLLHSFSTPSIIVNAIGCS